MKIRKPNYLAANAEVSKGSHDCDKTFLNKEILFENYMMLSSGMFICGHGHHCKYLNSQEMTLF